VLPVTEISGRFNKAMRALSRFVFLAPGSVRNQVVAGKKPHRRFIANKDYGKNNRFSIPA
jgi:hypothetical protein